MRSAPLYPFFVAIYPALAAAAGNTHLGVSILDIWLPMAIALAFAGVVWLGTGTFVKDLAKRALIATLLLAFVFWYGYLVAVFETLGIASSTLLKWLFPAGLATLIIGTTLLARVKTVPTGLNAYLNLMFGILLIFPLVNLGKHVITDQRDQVRTAHLDILTDSVVPLLDSEADRPDIYFIVLDAYTGSRSLSQIYGFDNSDFVDNLRDLGFVVQESQRSNYVITFLSLASILNWDYVHRLMSLNPRSSNQTPVYGLIEHNRTVAALKHLGYQFVFLPTSYPMSSRNHLADIELRPGDNVNHAAPGVEPQQSGTTRLTISGLTCQPTSCNHLLEPWLRATALLPLYMWTHRLVDAVAVTPPPVLGESGEQILWKFDQLGRLPNRVGPLFVFAHVILPHEPFQFQADCAFRETTYWPSQVKPWEEQRVRSAYVEQLTCANQLVLKLVHRLQGRSDRPPVILLQSDHGYARFESGAPRSLALSRPDQVEERIDAFAAYYMPGVEPASLPANLTSVNLFRIVLSEYFGADLPLIEDVTYWSAFERPYDLKRVWPPAASELNP